MRYWGVFAAVVAAWWGVSVAGSAEPANSTVITSQRLTFDYKQYVAVFEGDVQVTDPELRMQADRMSVSFEGTNSVKSLTASGNVRISQGDKVASCDRAVYVARNGEMVLRGNAQLQRPGDSVMGDEITFWLHEDRMTCVPGRLIIGAESMGTSGGKRKSLQDAVLTPGTTARP